MTTYSMMPIKSQYAVLASWPTEDNEATTRVTTVAEQASAESLAQLLTWLSEAAWNSETWLDTRPASTAVINELVAALRSSSEQVPRVNDLDGHAHRLYYRDSFYELFQFFEGGAPHELTTLTRPQRLSVAEEIATDASARAATFAQLTAGADLTATRGHQACLVTRSLSYGVKDYLPDSGPSWITRHYGLHLDPALRWRARNHLRRMEQLTAACEAMGGKAWCDHDPIEAKLVMPTRAEDEPPTTYTVTPYLEFPRNHRVYATADLTIRQGRDVIATVDALDDNAFATHLGEWTREVPLTP